MLGGPTFGIMCGVGDALVLAVAQPLCRGGDLTANARAHAAVVRGARARVVVFPELSLTGYEPGAEAVDIGDPALTPLVGACARSGAVALAGAPVRGRGGGLSNALLAVDADGVRVAYRKMWLGEAEVGWFTAGDRPGVLEVDRWRLGLAICKDTGVDAHATATAALGIDAYLAGVLETERDGGVPEQRARRIAHDHDVAVAIASFAGSTGGGYTDAAGRSGIWSAQGLVLSRAGTEPGEVATAALG